MTSINETRTNQQREPTHTTRNIEKHVEAQRALRNPPRTSRNDRSHHTRHIASPRVFCACAGGNRGGSHVCRRRSAAPGQYFGSGLLQRAVPWQHSTCNCWAVGLVQPMAGADWRSERSCSTSAAPLLGNVILRRGSTCAVLAAISPTPRPAPLTNHNREAVPQHVRPSDQLKRGGTYGPTTLILSEHDENICWTSADIFKPQRAKNYAKLQSPQLFFCSANRFQMLHLGSNWSK